MQTSVNLEPSFSYTILYWVIFLTLILIIVLWFLEKNKKENKVVVEIENNTPNIKSIKLKYLKKLTILENKIDKNEITIRKAYQNLSSIIRYFVNSVTGIKVQNCTLEDIKKLKCQCFTNLLRNIIIQNLQKNL